MGKKNKSQSQKSDTAQLSGLPFLGGNATIDPGLASLFEQSSGPVKAPSLPSATASRTGHSQKTKNNIAEENEIEDGDEESEREDINEVMQDADGSDSESGSAEEEATTARSRKRKRAAAEDLEESYMRRIAKEEREEEQKRQSEKLKRQKVESRKDDSDTPSDGSVESEESDTPSDGSDESEGDNETTAVPMHESQSGEKQASEVEKSRRTVFLGNVSTEAIKSKSAKKTLLKHLGSFLPTLPESTGPHKVESIRFRSTAFTNGGLVPKRASYARKEILDDTTHSTNAYAVYTTAHGARKAVSMLNGTVVLGRHLRVDNVAHPSPVDHKRCVFVGNLDFVDHEQSSENEQGKKKKNSKPADVEEGLWRTFNSPAEGSQGTQSGKVESVRVIRDRSTRVGKGFAYVQFYDQNGVEEALLLDGKRFPPMLPRKLRVVRAKKIAKKNPETSQGPSKGGSFRGSDRSLLGRADRLLGKAGAAKLKANGTNSQGSVVFEGHRATENGSRIKMRTKSRGSKGKPKTRSSKRAAAYRAARGQKEKSKV